MVRVSRDLEIIRRNRKLERRVSFISSNEKAFFYVLKRDSEALSSGNLICEFYIEQFKVPFTRIKDLSLKYTKIGDFKQ